MKRYGKMFLLLLGTALASAAAVSDQVGFDQRVGERLPLREAFRDERGTERRLGDFFGRRPVVLIFGYARCPQLCSIVTDGATETLRRLRWSAGRDFDVVSISIDPTETPAEAQRRGTEIVRRYGRPGGGWHFLIGSAAAIGAATRAAGFLYADAPQAGQFRHPSGIVVVTPSGTIARYFTGLDFPADEVARALEAAGQEQTGSLAANLGLICLRGDGPVGRYGRLIWTVLALGVALTVATLAGGVGWMLHQERRAARRGEPVPNP